MNLCTQCAHDEEVHTVGGFIKACKDCFCSSFNGIQNEAAAKQVKQDRLDNLSKTHGVRVEGKGNGYAKLMIVGEAPGRNEAIQGEPFVGQSGEFLDGVLGELGISRSEIYITNVVKVRPPDNSLKELKSIGRTIEEFVPELWNEVKAVKPNCILALGNLALSTLTGKTGILHYRGSILPASGSLTKVVGSVHPANFLRSRGEGGLDYKYRVIFKYDLKRAYLESLEAEYKIPQRLIRICKSSLDLYNWITQHRSRGLRRVAVDIETSKCIPNCIGLAFDKNSAMSVPLYDLQGYYTKHGTGPRDINQIWRLLIELLGDPEIEVIGQNFKFDHEKLLAPLGINVANVYGDTMLLAHCIHPELPKSLEFLTSIYTREPFYKFEGKEFNIKKDSVEVLYKYNAKDACVTIEIHEKMLAICEEMGIDHSINQPFSYFDHIMPLHKFYMDLERVGIKYDFVAQEKLSSDYRAKESVMVKRFEFLTGYTVVSSEEQKEIRKQEKKKIYVGPKHINFNSPAQLADLLHELGFPIRADTGEDTLVALLGNHAKTENLKEILGLIIDIRKIRKTISTYIDASPDYDGRIRSNYRIVGTETGRSSTSILQPPVRPHKIGHAAHTLTKHGDIGPEIRSLYITDEGFCFMEADLSQAEPRIVANLSNDDETLRLFDSGQDFHSLTASWLFSLPIDDVLYDKEHKGGGIRFVGKTVRNGGNYDMAKGRVMVEVNTGARKFHIPMSVNEKEAGVLLSKFHQYTPKIRGVFHEDIKRALKDFDRTLVNPFGRPRKFLARWGGDLFREAFAQIPQSTVRDQVIRAGISLRKRFPEISIVIESHDALVALVPLDRQEEYKASMIEEFERPIDFSRCSLPRNPLIIPCEIQISYDSYKNLKKVA